MTETKQSVSVGFTGDVTFTQYFGNDTERSGILSPEISSFLAGTDHCVCNVEGPFTARKKTRESNFLHSSPPEAAVFLPEHGMDIWNLANNHMLDFGPGGLQDTLNRAASLNCSTIGAGENASDAAKPYLLDEAGGVGIIGITYSASGSEADPGGCCLRWNDHDRICEAIRLVKSQSRWCVLVIHGGEEFSSMPMQSTRDRYLHFLETGADVIVGHHPHVVQNYEQVNGKLIFYSLGNFIFDTDYQRAQKNTEVGILLKLSFSAEKMTWDHLPVRINRTSKTLEVSDTPVIFTELSASDYNMLLPYAAKALIRANRKRDAFLYPEKYRSYPRWKWSLRELYRCRNRQNRKLVMLSLRAGKRRMVDARLEQLRAYLYEGEG